MKQGRESRVGESEQLAAPTMSCKIRISFAGPWVHIHLP